MNGRRRLAGLTRWMRRDNSERKRADPVPTPDRADTRVLVLVREGCHLCVDAAEVAAAVCSDAGVQHELRDVDTDDELRAAYTDHVPVTFVDGALLSYWGLDPDALRSALGESG